jgi:acyl carrier protein
MSKSIHDRVCAVIASVFGIPIASINEGTSSNSVETWDSMNHIQLIVAIESEFEVSFEPEQAIGLTSVRAIEQALVALDVR